MIVNKRKEGAKIPQCDRNNNPWYNDDEERQALKYPSID